MHRTPRAFSLRNAVLLQRQQLEPAETSIRRDACLRCYIRTLRIGGQRQWNNRCPIKSNNILLSDQTVRRWKHGIRVYAGDRNPNERTTTSEVQRCRTALRCTSVTVHSQPLLDSRHTDNVRNYYGSPVIERRILRESLAMKQTGSSLVNLTTLPQRRRRARSAVPLHPVHPVPLCQKSTTFLHFALQFHAQLRARCVVLL